MTSPYPTMAESRAIADIGMLARNRHLAERASTYDAIVRESIRIPSPEARARAMAADDLLAAYRNAVDPYGRKEH
jgi:hypothetical protein